MAIFVEGGADLFDSLVYGDTYHPNTQQFLLSQVERPTNHLTEMGQQFFSGLRDIYERVSGSHAMRTARAASRKVASIWQSDEIRQLKTIGQCQQAPLTMQRWIMANPTVRRMYQQQRLEGYSETYLDVEPNVRGEEHYDYRRAMNGVIIDTDDGWYSTTYYDDLVEGDRELTLEEKVDILDTWDTVLYYIRQGGEDPTSPSNAEL